MNSSALRPTLGRPIVVVQSCSPDGLALLAAEDRLALLADRGAGLLVVLRLEEEGLGDQLVADALAYGRAIDVVDELLGHGEIDGRLRGDVLGHLEGEGA